MISGGSPINWRRTVLTVGLACVLITALAACDSNDEYVDEVNALTAEYDEYLSDLDPTPKTLGEIRRLAARGAELDSQLARDMAAIEAPDEVTDLHADLVALLEENAADSAEIEKLALAAENYRDLQRVREATANARKNQARFDSLIEQINEEL